MRRILLIGAIILLSCQAVSTIDLQATLPGNSTPTVYPTELPPTATALPSATPTAIAAPDFEVLLHPDGSLYVGDQVSMEVIAHGDIDLAEKQVQIRVAGVQEEQGQVGFNEFGIGGRLQATFDWVWDTSQLQPGEYQINFSIQPGGPAWRETVVLLPRENVPNPEPHAQWETARLDCCIIHYISGTDFAQDLPLMQEVIERQADEAQQVMGVNFEHKVNITILPRVLGHGGFAADEIYISYLEDNYAGNDLPQVLHHEMVHILDRQLGGELRPSLLVEGLAVYLSRGHFKREPLISRAAALMDLGWYLPLDELADAFYTSQHEIGYLEGGALIDFMVNRYGWEAFSDFYRDIHPHPSDRQSKAIDQALQEHFDISLEQLEGSFTAELRRQHINPDMRADLIQSVEFYEAVRRYQLMLDPSAYFLNAWLPEGERMRERSIVADYLRQPDDPQNGQIVALLVEVDRQIRAGNYPQAEKSLWLVNQKLDHLQNEELIGN